MKKTVIIFGDIGDWWEGTDKASFINSVRSTGYTEVDFIISSPGGLLDDSLVIYDLIKSIPVFTRTIGTGFVGSGAALIHQAGDERVLTEQAVLIPHFTQSFAGGNKDDLRREADEMDQTDEAIINIYSKSTRQSREMLAQKLKQDYYMSPQLALSEGFVDVIIPTLPQGSIEDGTRSSISSYTYGYLNKLKADRPQFYNSISKVLKPKTEQMDFNKIFNKYFNLKSGFSMDDFSKEFQNLLASEKQAPQFEASTVEKLNSLASFDTAGVVRQADLEALTTKLNALETKATDLATQLAAKDTSITNLTNEITAIKTGKKYNSGDSTPPGGKAPQLTKAQEFLQKSGIDLSKTKIPK